MHAAFGAFLGGVFVTFWVWSFVAAVFFTPNSIWKNEAIDRGYALYCPVDGVFAWKGECKND
jgi:hypothetical protein